ncbi:hypothetical protein D3C81_2218990 [compost metagenome]
MDHDQRAFPLGSLQRLVQHAVVGLEGIFVGHEYLQRGDPFILNNLRQFAKHLVIQLRDHQVKAVINNRLIL